MTIIPQIVSLKNILMGGLIKTNEDVVKFKKKSYNN